MTRQTYRVALDPNKVDELFSPDGVAVNYSDSVDFHITVGYNSPEDFLTIAEQLEAAAANFRDEYEVATATD